MALRHLISIFMTVSIVTYQQNMFEGILYENPILETSIAGINRDEFINMYLQRVNYSDLRGMDYISPAYDAIWAASLALNMTQGKLENKGVCA